MAGADTARIWDAATGLELACLTGERQYEGPVAWSPDGGRLATVADGNAVRVCDAATGQEVLRLAGHEGYVACVAWSADGRLILSADWENAVRVWDAATGAERAGVRDQTREVTGVAGAGDGALILIRMWDSSVEEWDALAGHRLRHHTPDSAAAVAARGEGNHPFVARGRLLQRGNELRDQVMALRSPDILLGSTLEMEVQEAGSRRPVAWLPQVCFHLAPHPSGRAWAGGDRNFVMEVALEGGDPEGRAP